jgi:hypothetical protein
MPLLDPTLIRVEIDSHLRDCPPRDEPIDEASITFIAEEIARRFDYTSVYDQIDEIACQILREQANSQTLRKHITPDSDNVTTIHSEDFNDFSASCLDL